MVRDRDKVLNRREMFDMKDFGKTTRRTVGVYRW